MTNYERYSNDLEYKYINPPDKQAARIRYKHGNRWKYGVFKLYSENKNNSGRDGAKKYWLKMSENGGNSETLRLDEDLYNTFIKRIDNLGNGEMVCKTFKSFYDTHYPEPPTTRGSRSRSRSRSRRR